MLKGGVKGVPPQKKPLHIILQRRGTRNRGCGGTASPTALTTTPFLPILYNHMHLHLLLLTPVNNTRRHITKRRVAPFLIVKTKILLKASMSLYSVSIVSNIDLLLLHGSP